VRLLRSDSLDLTLAASVVSRGAEVGPGNESNLREMESTEGLDDGDERDDMDEGDDGER